jgi:plasmid stabilization system protein ParE
MTAVWSPRAIGHLIALRAHIARESEQNAAAVARRILSAIEVLKTQPGMGRPGRVAGTRELVISGTGLIVPYRVREGRLEIIAVFHGRQRWPDRL